MAADTLRSLIEEQHFGENDWADRHVDADGFDIFDDDYVDLDFILDMAVNDIRFLLALGRAVEAERAYTEELDLKNPNLMFARGANARLRGIYERSGVQVYG